MWKPLNNVAAFITKLCCLNSHTPPPRRHCVSGDSPRSAAAASAVAVFLCNFDTLSRRVLVLCSVEANTCATHCATTHDASSSSSATANMHAEVAPTSGGRRLRQTRPEPNRTELNRKVPLKCLAAVAAAFRLWFLPQGAGSARRQLSVDKTQSKEGGKGRVGDPPWNWKMKSVKGKVKNEQGACHGNNQCGREGRGARRSAKFFSHKQRQIIDMETSKNTQLEIEGGGQGKLIKIFSLSLYHSLCLCLALKRGNCAN